MVQFASASIAAAAFCLELYFKALITLEVGKPRGTHKLKDLYDTLRPRTKKLIRDEYDRRTGPMQKAIESTAGIKHDLDFVLTQANDAFELMRYLYDLNKEKRTGSGWNAWPVIEVVRDVTLDLRPDWPVANGAPSTFPPRSKQ